MPEKINYNYLLRGNIFSTSTVVYDTGTIGNISKRAGIYKISLPSLALLGRSLLSLHALLGLHAQQDQQVAGHHSQFMHGLGSKCSNKSIQTTVFGST